MLTTILGLIGFIISFFEFRRGRALGYCAHLWARLILFFSGINDSVRGLHQLESNKSYIFAGNHASEIDILLAFAGLPFWIVSIAKIELRSIPVLGWVMRAAGHIFVDRNRKSQSIESLKMAKESLINMPRSVLLFPEGTRTKNGLLNQFKRGGLLLGIEANIPIVPIAFINTFAMVDKNSLTLRNHSIELRIGKPIINDHNDYESKRGIANHVQKEVQYLIDN